MDNFSSCLSFNFLVLLISLHPADEGLTVTDSVRNQAAGRREGSSAEREMWGLLVQPTIEMALWLERWWIRSYVIFIIVLMRGLHILKTIGFRKPQTCSI